MSEGIAQLARTAESVDLGLMDYGSALSLQVETVRKKIKTPSQNDILFFVEHPGVFTLGRRGGLENLTVSESFLKEKGIRIFQTDRGGNITYHGPGQAVLYPVVDLEKNKIAVKDFVWGLEEIMRRTARDFDVAADRDDRNHGVWVKNAKIGSVGLSIKKGISFHGLAMNINPDLTPFSWINPCGLSNVAMTSIMQENPQKIPIEMPEVKLCFIKHFSEIFNFTVY